MSYGRKTRFNCVVKASFAKLALICVPHLIVFTLLFLAVFFMENSGVVLSVYLLILVFIVISFMYFSKLHLMMSLNKSVYEIHKDSEDNWRLIFSANRSEKVFLSGLSFESNVLIILNFVDLSGRSYPVLLTADSVSREEFRYLKVFLRTQKIDSLN